MIPHKKFDKRRPLQSLIRASNVLDQALDFKHSFHVLYNVSMTFYSKTSSLIIPSKNFEKRRVLLGFFCTCFKRPEFRFTNKGFDFMHSFTVLYSMFLWHSILNHQAWSFPTKSVENI